MEDFFLPASGARDSNGVLFSRGSMGTYFASLRHSSSSPYYLLFSSSESHPSRAQTNFVEAFPIRCVR